MIFDRHLIEGFSESVLARRYDNRLPVPDFHRELWETCTLPDKKVAIIAPRGHAKSTSVTHAYTLANVLFRQRKYVIIISDTEEQAVEFLGDIRSEIRENEDIKPLFGIKRIIKDAETNFICEFEDGEQFRIMAKGAGQKIRGRKWRGKRPDLIVIDDLENDELVENQDRREKLRSWFMKSVMPSLSSDGVIRYVGTILHLDALLERISKNPEWTVRRYKAHKSYNDFSEILWPELHTEESLKSIRADYVAQGMPEGYSCEYLNDPVAVEDRLFRDQDFIAMKPEDFNKPMVYFAAADFAISQREKADNTVMVVGGICPEGYLYIVDRIKGRIDSEQIIEEMINIQKRYKPEIFLLESEKIDKAIGPFLRKRMLETGVFINVHTETPTKDKIARAQSIAARMKQGAVRFHKENDWYEDFYNNLAVVTRSGVKGAHDDDLDAFAWLGLAIDKFWESPTLEQIDQQEYEAELDEFMDFGACEMTGY